MGKWLFHLAGAVIRISSRKMSVKWEAPFTEGPCVFVVGGAGMKSPLEMLTKFPLRSTSYPWIDHRLLRKETAEDYLFPAHTASDRPLRLKEKLLARCLPALLQGANCVPVYEERRVLLTFRQSIRLLLNKKALLVFPENGTSGRGQWIGNGWLRLGELWYHAQGKALRFYPVHINAGKHLFEIAKPVLYDPSLSFIEQREKLQAAITRGMHPAAGSL